MIYLQHLMRTHTPFFPLVVCHTPLVKLRSAAGRIRTIGIGIGGPRTKKQAHASAH